MTYSLTFSSNSSWFQHVSPSCFHIKFYLSVWAIQGVKTGLDLPMLLNLYCNSHLDMLCQSLKVPNSYYIISIMRKAAISPVHSEAMQGLLARSPSLSCLTEKPLKLRVFRNLIIEEFVALASSFKRVSLEITVCFPHGKAWTSAIYERVQCFNFYATYYDMVPTWHPVLSVSPAEVQRWYGTVCCLDSIDEG